MTAAYLEAIILGIVQGLTEFLPVSSSGHLEIAQYLLGEQQSIQSGLIMTITLHAATALSTLVVFRKEIGTIFRGLMQTPWQESHLFARNIALSMLPAVGVGLFYEDAIDQLFEGKIVLVSAMLIVTAVLLFLADRAPRGNRGIGMREAILIGLAQMVAILPGISRSGATISTAVMLRIDRETAAQFSFLMVIPLIFGKMAKDLLDGSSTAVGVDIIPLALGFVAAFLTGYIACAWMIRMVQRSKLGYFAWYCLLVGGGMLLFTTTD